MKREYPFRPDAENIDKAAENADLSDGIADNIINIDAILDAAHKKLSTQDVAKIEKEIGGLKGNIPEKRLKRLLRRSISLLQCLLTGLCIIVPKINAKKSQQTEPIVLKDPSTPLSIPPDKKEFSDQLLEDKKQVFKLLKKFEKLKKSEGEEPSKIYEKLRHEGPQLIEEKNAILKALAMGGFEREGQKENMEKDLIQTRLKLKFLMDDAERILDEITQN